MSLLRALFGPSKEEIWRQLSTEIGARFNDGGFWGTSYVQADVNDWTVTLDTYTVSTGKSSVTYTRMRAPFVNRDGFRFTIRREGFFDGLGKLFGMQDLVVGHPEFDEAFVIQGNNNEKLRGLFGSSRVRELVQAQPRIMLNIVDDEGWFAGRFPEGVDQLHFVVVGIIKDLQVLRALFELYSEVLNQLCHMDSAYEDDLALHLDALLAPGGQIKSGEMVTWDGDPPRRRAAETLGRLKDPRARGPLQRVLQDPDFVLRVKAIWALGEIGDRQAVPALVPLLGDQGAVAPDRAAPHEAAVEALSKLGESEFALAFAAALRGDRDGLSYIRDRYREPVIAAFVRALASSNPAVVIHAAHALQEMAALEALPALRKALRETRGDASRAAVDQAVERLAAHAALPRPSEASAPDAASLPRPSAADGS